jgi:hypothetical protein
MNEKLTGIVKMSLNAFLAFSINCKNEFLTHKIVDSKSKKIFL